MFLIQSLVISVWGWGRLFREWEGSSAWSSHSGPRADGGSVICIMWFLRLLWVSSKRALRILTVVVQSLSPVLFAAPWTAALQASLSFTVAWNSLKLMPIELVMPPNHLILCCHLFLASIFPRIRIFSNELTVCIRWPNIGASASAFILPVNVQGWLPLGLTGWISLQSKGLSRVFFSTTIWKHQFFGAQPSLWSTSHIYNRTTGKNEALTKWTLPAKWCLCFLIRYLGFS